MRLEDRMACAQHLPQLKVLQGEHPPWAGHRWEPRAVDRLVELESRIAPSMPLEHTVRSPELVVQQGAESDECRCAEGGLGDEQLTSGRGSTCVRQPLEELVQMGQTAAFLDLRRLVKSLSRVEIYRRYSNVHIVRSMPFAGKSWPSLQSSRGTSTAWLLILATQVSLRSGDWWFASKISWRRILTSATHDVEEAQARRSQGMEHGS